MGDRAVVIGASRGLGAALSKLLVKGGVEVLGVARKEELLKDLANQSLGKFKPFVFDLLASDGWDSLESILSAHAPSRIYYVAGGGPYGFFKERPFHAHQWAWKVTFEAAARLCHWSLRQARSPQMVLVGSSICEERPDPMASSYAAAKHALKGFYESLRAENKEWDLRLFSPGYLDTELLPKNASVRYKNLWSPHEVAKDLIEWSFNEKYFGEHKKYLNLPDDGEEKG